MQNSCLYFDDFFPVKLYATFLLPIKCIFGQFLHYLIHVLWLQQYRLIRKLQMKEKYLGKVEFGKGFYLQFSLGAKRVLSTEYGETSISRKSYLIYTLCELIS